MKIKAWIYELIKEEAKKEEVKVAGVKKEAIDPPVEAPKTPEPEKKKLPVSEVPKTIEPQEVEQLKTRTSQVTKEIVEVAKEGNKGLKEIYGKVMKLESMLENAKAEAKAASDKVLSEAKTPKLQEDIRMLSQQLNKEIGEGERVAVTIGDTVLGKIESQTEKSDYKYYVETEKDVLTHIKQLQEEKNKKIEVISKEMLLKVLRR